MTPFDPSRPFSRAQALAAGHSPGEIRSLLKAGTWRRVRYGVYVAVAAPAEPRAAVLEAAAALPATITAPLAVSHRSAAFMHRLDLLGREPALPLHVTVDRDARRGSCAGVVLHRSRLSSAEVTTVDGVPVTSIARTVVDIARTSSFAAGVVVADSAVRSGLPVEELRQVAERCRRWRGGPNAVRVAAFADPGAEAPSESLLRVVCAEAGIQLLLQVRLHDADGFLGRVDAVVAGSRVVVEVDGMLKYDRPEALREEKLREDRLREAGWEVVRVTWGDLLHRR